MRRDSSRRHSKSRAGQLALAGSLPPSPETLWRRSSKRPGTTIGTGEFMKRLSLLLAAALLHACAVQKKEPNVNLGGYPPEFRAGYLDGCASPNTSPAGTMVSTSAANKKSSPAPGFRPRRLTFVSHRGTCALLCILPAVPSA